MKTILLLSCALVLLSRSVSLAELTGLEKKYLDRFANYTGNMGIGFVPEHTFDYDFRQAILRSKDESVQKAFILHALPSELEGILDTLKSGRKMIGKGQYRNLTNEDRKLLLGKFDECMTLLEKLDGNNNKHFYSEYRSKRDEIVGNRKTDAN